MNVCPLLVLASSSPRRRELLEQHGFTIRVVPPEIDEPDLPPVFDDSVGDGKNPAHFAEASSHFKASAVAQSLDSGLVLGGDTVVALGSRVFGKPRDRADAGRIIRALAGTDHDVITGLTLMDAASGRRHIAHARTIIRMRDIDDTEVESYLDTGAWSGKAGAYGIQDHGDAFVTDIQGSFTNVVGLPMELLFEMLGRWGYAVPSM